MYNCSSCGNNYELSEANNNMLPEEHIIKCPHCEHEHVIGADEDEYWGELVYIMYGYSKKDNIDYSHLKVIEGDKILPGN